MNAQNNEQKIVLMLRSDLMILMKRVHNTKNINYVMLI